MGWGRSENVPPDKLESDILAFIGLREREMLSKMAERDGRTEIEELKWLIRSRALGQLEDLGDRRSPVQLRQSDLSQYVQVESLGIESLGRGSDNRYSSDPLPPRPK